MKLYLRKLQIDRDDMEAFDLLLLIFHIDISIFYKQIDLKSEGLKMTGICSFISIFQFVHSTNW